MIVEQDAVDGLGFQQRKPGFAVDSFQELETGGVDMPKRTAAAQAVDQVVLDDQQAQQGWQWHTRFLKACR